MNRTYSAMSCYEVPEFRPGGYTVDPRDIWKFGDDGDDLDYEANDGLAEDNPPSYPFFGVDSGAVVIADFAHLPKLVEDLTWERYDLAMQDCGVFERINESLGGPYFALILSNARLGMDFDGDGTYTLRPGSVRRSSA
jgi:hypothetical protein